MLEFLQQNMMWAALAVASGGMLVWPMLRGGGRHSISATDATLLINREDAVVVDVRETSEWSAGHIPEARHITLAQLEKRLSELDKFKQRPLIVYCERGNRSLAAVTTLKRAGFERAFSLSGGIAAWSEASLPVTSK